MTRSLGRPACAMALLCVAPAASSGQTPDTLRPPTLPLITVTVTRAERPLTKLPLAVQSLDRAQISRANPTWGLDEALANVPGVFVANRYNFSQDQRISIRGFGARSAFAVRGIKILVDGIPQTLPDGQGQLTNLELGEVDRIEVLRGSASALFGNASGGVISISTRPPPIKRISQEARFVGGSFGEPSGRTWNKWRSTTAARIGDGIAQLTVARLDYEGERDHSAADQRVLNARLWLPIADSWSLMLVTEVGDHPRADNPGSLTLAELQTNRDTVPALNSNRNAGKDVTQFQSGATLRRTMANGGEAAVTVFGLRRDLKNPITTTYIDLEVRRFASQLETVPSSELGPFARIMREPASQFRAGSNVLEPSVEWQIGLPHATRPEPLDEKARTVAPSRGVVGPLQLDHSSPRVCRDAVACGP
jgi:iron complex outermembrane receptor protein